MYSTSKLYPINRLLSNLSYLHKLLGAKIDFLSLLQHINFRGPVRQARNLVHFFNPLLSPNYLANEPLAKCTCVQCVIPTRTPVSLFLTNDTLLFVSFYCIFTYFVVVNCIIHLYIILPCLLLSICFFI